MIEEHRYVYYDSDLDLEIYNLRGIVDKFPNHFHEYFVIGFIEGGKRHLFCNGNEYSLSAGDIILFNPYDKHYCQPIDNEPLDYRAINIKSNVLYKYIKDAGLNNTEFNFSQNVVFKSEIANSIGILFNLIINKKTKLEKEEAFYFLLDQLIQEFGTSCDFKSHLKKSDVQIDKVCSYINDNFAQNLNLNDLVSVTSYGKSYLLRQFTKQTGISPYRYLQTVRINNAKKMLENGTPPIEVAFETGFADQSHFTNFFKEFIGLTPKQYQKIFINTTIEVSHE